MSDAPNLNEASVVFDNVSVSLGGVSIFDSINARVPNAIPESDACF